LENINGGPINIEAFNEQGQVVIDTDIRETLRKDFG
jgi:hypothetical protein